MVSLPTTSPTHLPHPSPSFSPPQQNKTLTVHHELKWYAAAGYQSKAGLMMATAAVLGVSAGNRLLTSSSLCYSDLTSDKLFHSPLLHDQTPSPTNLITAKRSTHRPTNIKAVKHQHQHLNTSTSAATADASLRSLDPSLYDYHYDSPSLEALLVLQKSMLEKQWELSCEPKSRNKFGQVVSSGVSARERRSMKRCVDPNSDAKRNHIGLIVSQEVLGSNRTKSYVKGVFSEELLTHAQVVHLSKKIKAGLLLEDYKSKLNKRLGYDPSDEQLATSLRISRAELQSKRIECSLAREKLAMSNVRLVMSVAKRYENMGVEMADLVQGGLIGLVRGIEKFDSSKGFKISTYVYWWIRQGVSRSLIENSRTLRLPAHLHERLSLIRNAKIRLEGKGITPSVEKIAESLNMSQKKVKNATEAISKVFSLDREAFPSLNGLPGETLHSYIADKRLENNPWHGVDEWILKDEVNNLIKTTLREREQDIIRLYYGLDEECLTWEDISRRIGLSRERVRQVGLVALEKLKHAARRRSLDAMLVKY